MIRGHVDEKIDPTETAIKGMIGWLNARQAGVSRARAEVGQDGVGVYHGAEVNRVVISMREGRRNMVNAVLPYTNVDLVSYSAWDAAVEHYVKPKPYFWPQPSRGAQHSPGRDSTALSARWHQKHQGVGP